MLILVSTLQSKVRSKKRLTEVHQQLKRMEQNKAVGPDGITIESFLALGDFGIVILDDMLNSCLNSAIIPVEWRQSTVTPIYKNKGDMDCSK